MTFDRDDVEVVDDGVVMIACLCCRGVAPTQKASKREQGHHNNRKVIAIDILVTLFSIEPKTRQNHM